MTPRTRFLIFLLFVLLFLIAAPYAVLRTAGYSYSFERRKLEPSSLIVLNSKPDGTRVVLDGEATLHQTPTRIEQVSPGERLVRLERPGYAPWEKRLTVRPGETAFAEHVRLWKQSPPTQLVAGAYSEFLPLQSRGAALLVRSYPKATLLFWDGTTRSPEAVWQGESVWSPGPKEIIVHASEERVLVRDPWKKQMFAIDLQNPKTPPVSLDTLSGKKITSAAWHPDQSFLRVLATTDDRRMLAIDPWTRNIKDMGSAPGSALYTNNDELFAVRDSLGSSVLIQVDPEDPKKINDVAPLRDPIARIIPGGAPYLGIINQKEELTILDLRKDPGAREVFRGKGDDGVWFVTKDGPRLLFEDSIELSWWDQVGGAHVIMRSGQGISAIAPYDDGHALFGWGALTAIEFDDRDKKNTASWDLREALGIMVVDRGGRALVAGTGPTGPGLYEVLLE